MKEYCVQYDERSTMPARLEQQAARLGITSEQLIKRYISAGINSMSETAGAAEPGTSVEDFLVRNGVWTDR